MENGMNQMEINWGGGEESGGKESDGGETPKKRREKSTEKATTHHSVAINQKAIVFIVWLNDRQLINK